MLRIEHSEIVLSQIKSGESSHYITQLLLCSIAEVDLLLLIRRKNLGRKWWINSILILLHLSLHLFLLWQDDLLWLNRLMRLHIVLNLARICLVIQ
jgi:hypothetical protein